MKTHVPSNGWNLLLGLVLALGLFSPVCGGHDKPDPQNGPDAGRDGGAGPDASADADSGLDSGGDAGNEPTLRKVSPQDLHAWLENKDFLLINVHTPNAGEIPGTDTHIAYNQVDQIVAYIGSDLNRKAVIYCLTNHMALIAGPAIVAKGYRNIWYLDGGMSGWQQAGYPLDP